MHVRITAQVWGDLVDRLLSRQDVETAGLLFAETLRVDGDQDVLVVREVALVPDAAYLERRVDRLRIDPVALNRLVRPARDRGWSIITVHTHPGTSTAWFSWADDAGDARLMPSFEAQIPGVRHGSLVLAGNGAAGLRLFAGDRVDAALLHIVGRRLITWPTGASSHSEVHERQLLALGEHGQAALRQMTVGVVGLGGTGSAVAAQLAHLGVKSLVLMDDDLVERSNISRILGATTADVGRPKVEVAARYAAGLEVPARPIGRALAHADDAAALYACDVVFSCVDRHVPRAILNRFAYAACVPVIDLGTVFRVDERGTVTGNGGRIVIAGPGRPCFACWGILDPERLRVEQLPPDELARARADGYVLGANLPQPSVISFNTSVAGHAVTEFLRMVTMFAGADDPPDRLSFSFSDGTVRRTGLGARVSCEICGGAPASALRGRPSASRVSPP